MGGDSELKALCLAARQQGVLRRDQAIACGLNPGQLWRRLQTGRWVCLMPGVYRVEGAPETWHQRLKAASLWAFREFALSHRTAAALLGFSRYREGPIELSVTRELRAAAGVTVHRVESLTPRALSSVLGLRVTSPTRTLLDLAAAEPEADVRASVDQALSRKWTTLHKLEAALTAAGRRRGMRLLRALLEDYLGGDGPSESELESRVVELFEAAGLPRPERQRTVRAGHRLRRLDFRLRGTPLVVEADGYAHHSSPAAFESDRARNNALTAQGFRVLHWTWAAVCERPDELIAELCRALRTGNR